MQLQKASSSAHMKGGEKLLWKELFFSFVVGGEKARIEASLSSQPGIQIFV